MHLSRFVLLLSSCVFLSACGQGTDTTPSSGDNGAENSLPSVYSVNYPLAWAAEQLLGEGAQVYFPAPQDVDPAFWQPDLQTISAYQQADIVLLNGANYARWLPRVSLAENRLLDTSRAFRDQFIPMNSGPVHSHGPEGKHSHGEFAFTLWLDLSLYLQQVEAIATALQERQAQEPEVIDRRQQDIVERMTALDAELENLGKSFNGAPILYSHPVYQYFNRRYEFNGRSLHWEPDQLPSAQDWSELVNLLEHHSASVMLWEAEPLPQTRHKLKELGVAVVVFKPMANRPEVNDFSTGMADNIQRLQAAMPPQ